MKLGRGPLAPVVAKLECYQLGVAVVTFPDLFDAAYIMEKSKDKSWMTPQGKR